GRSWNDRSTEAAVKRAQSFRRHARSFPGAREVDVLLGVFGGLFQLIGPGFQPIVREGHVVLSVPAIGQKMIKAAFGLGIAHHVQAAISSSASVFTRWSSRVLGIEITPSRSNWERLRDTVSMVRER